MALKKVSKAVFMDLISSVLANARENLQADGYLDMIVFWVTPDGGLVVDASLNEALKASERLHERGQHDEAAAVKSAIWENLRNKLEQQKAIGYFLISEAWVSMKEMAKGDVAFGEEPGQVLLPETQLPRFDFKRREAIIVNWEWKGPPKNVHSSGLIQQFYRRQGDRIILEEIERRMDPSGGQAEGMLR